MTRNRITSISRGESRSEKRSESRSEGTAQSCGCRYPDCPTCGGWETGERDTMGAPPRHILRELRQALQAQRDQLDDLEAIVHRVAHVLLAGRDGANFCPYCGTIWRHSHGCTGPSLLNSSTGGCRGQSWSEG